MYIFPFCLSVLFVFILYLFQKSWSKGMSNLFLSCPAPKLLILASIKCNFLDFNFFCACLFVCLFYFDIEGEDDDDDDDDEAFIVFVVLFEC